MDTQSKTDGLPGVRTYAKDLEKKRAQTKRAVSSSTQPVNTPTVATLPVPQAQVEERKYLAPSWSGQKKAPPQKPAVVTKTSSETPKTTLQPIAPLKLKSEPTIIVENEDAATATIIRDTKKDRFQLFPAMIASISNWFKEFKLKRAAKKIPKYTVPETSHRKGIIQKATSKTGKVASFDYQSIQDRVRQRQEKTSPHKPSTTWTANTEPGFLLLETANQGVTNVQVVHRKSYQVPEPEPEPTSTWGDEPARLTEPVFIVEPPPMPVRPPVVTPPPVVEKPIVKAAPLPVPPVNRPRSVFITQTPPVSKRETIVPTLNSPETTPAPTLTKPEPIPVRPPVETIPTPTVEQPPVLIQPALKPKSTPAQPVLNQGRRQPRFSLVTRLKPASLREWLFTINTNTISLGMAGLVSALVITGTIGYFWFSTQVESINLTKSPEHPSLINAPLQLLVPASLEKTALIETILSNIRESTYEVLQLTFVTSAAGSTLVPPPLIISALDLAIDNAFTQAITNLYFGGLKQSQPFVLLKVSDQATAQGGMLAWEDTMYAKLSPLLYPDISLTAEELRTATFTDIVIADIDVRVLKTKAGKEVLVYGLVNRNTLIITQTSQAFAELKALIP